MRTVTLFLCKLKDYSQEAFIVAFKSVDGLYTKLWMNLTCALYSGLKNTSQRTI